MSQTTARPAADAPVATKRTREARLLRWLPAAGACVTLVAILAVAGAPWWEIGRYASYALIGVMIPGTLVYRSLRRTPLTLVEDLAMGAAVGLVLELAAWAVFSVLDLRGWVRLWPFLVMLVYAALPALRRHWWVREYPQRAPLAWSWTVAGVVSFWSLYLSSVFLQRNPAIPTSEGTRQYLDLAYQLSLAGEAKNHLPLHLPQVAGEPLYYHWFAYAHMAMSSMVGGVDLTSVSLRYAIPALCALAIVLTATVGWRVSKRPAVGAVAAILFFTIGEFNFTDPVTMPFGTQATFVIWHGMSMIYSWVLLIALIGAIGLVLLEDKPGVRAYVLAGLLVAGSSGAKASSLPVVLGALGIAGLALLIAYRRIPWRIVILGAVALAGQFFATAVLYQFQTYKTGFALFGQLEPYWLPLANHPRGPLTQALISVGVFGAFLLNMELRQAGIIPLLWRQKLRLEPIQWVLLGGGLAGVLFYLTIHQLSGGEQYFARSGFTFGVILSGWGFVQVLDRAKLGRRGRLLLGLGAAVFALATVLIQLAYAKPFVPHLPRYRPVLPILEWAGALLAVGVVVAAAWLLLRRRVPALRGRGGVVLLTAVLVAGAPGLVMDMAKSERTPNGGAYYNIDLPRSRVLAARYVRDHSGPDDVLATNVHCVGTLPNGKCDPRSFWLSAYAERRVLVEGWTFAPRIGGDNRIPFWDQALLTRNDDAIAAPTPEKLAALRHDYGVRWIVVDDQGGTAYSVDLGKYADLRYTNSRIKVYELR